jgi:hypothetical protein
VCDTRRQESLADQLEARRGDLLKRLGESG